MKRAVLQFTACVLAAGMTVSGTGIAAFAAKDDALAGFGGTAAVQSVSGSTAEDTQESETTAETQTEEAVTEAATEAAQEAATEAVQETAAEAAQDTTDASTAEETENSAQAGVLDTSMNGQMAFAQCEEYINVRKEASADSEVVGKVYNNGSVTILGAIDGWYKVQSGNATGYVNAEYFATGAQAEAIAEEVGYNVATVYSDALTVRSQPSEDSEAIGTVYSSDQLEVVAYEGDWMKVALGNDVYGYVNAYYVGYDTYYATAETLDEEQARLDQQWTDYLAQQKAEEDRQNQQWQEYLDTQAAQESASAASYEDQSYEAPQTEAVSYDSGSDAQAQADAAYQNYLAAQAAADAATTQADEQQVYDTAAAAQEAYQEYVNAQAAADAQAAGGSYTEDSSYTEETEAPQYYEETPQTEAPSYDYSYTGDAQAAADAAYQRYLEAQAAADAATTQGDEQAVYDTAAAAQEAYQAYLNAQAAADAQAAGGYTGETTQTEAPAYEETEAPQYEETEAPAYEETEAPQYEETEAPQTEAPASSTGMAIVNFATQFVGNPYVWGGTSLTNGADCSGFTQSVFANFGISIPRTAAAQASSGTPVDLSEIQAGDLLFYYGDSGIGHVTIYMGNGQVVHASNASTGITISDYGYRTPCSARRYW